MFPHPDSFHIRTILLNTLTLHIPTASTPSIEPHLPQTSTSPRNANKSSSFLPHTDLFLHLTSFQFNVFYHLFSASTLILTNSLLYLNVLTIPFPCPLPLPPLFPWPLSLSPTNYLSCSLSLSLSLHVPLSLYYPPLLSFVFITPPPTPFHFSLYPLCIPLPHYHRSVITLGPLQLAIGSPSPSALGSIIARLAPPSMIGSPTAR